MLFHVRMDVRLPHDADSKLIEKLRTDEKARAQQLQLNGTWRHLWRIVGEYARTGRVPNVVNLAKTSPATHLLVVHHYDQVGVLSAGLGLRAPPFAMR